MFSRTLMLALAGLALLVAPGCGSRQSASEGTPGRSDRDPGAVLAKVGDRKIRESDLEARLEQVPVLARGEFSSPAGRERLLRQVIEEELLVRAARDEGLTKDPAIASEIDRSERSILAQAFLDRKQREMTQISEADAREFFDAHRDEYFQERLVRVRLFQNRNETIAKRAREMVVDDHLPMEQVCNRFCEDPRLIESGGELPGWIRKGKSAGWLGNHPRFHEVVFALPVGEVSELFQTVLGWHFAVVEEERPAHEMTFEEARADVEGRIQRERSTKGLPELLDELNERYHVEVLETERDAEAVFAEAQAASDARQAVQLYEELIRRWPDDARVPEALFMAGFQRAETLGDSAGANEAFRRLLDEFPDSELAQSARFMIESGGEGAPEFEPEESPAREESTP
ncbi:MAG: tetratricopeptide repeat protein [Gemmatimonadetes bacterium]|nr:tetratricopeptide repeat protein [Gemmatimonadota bacterium]